MLTTTAEERRAFLMSALCSWWLLCRGNRFFHADWKREKQFAPITLSLCCTIHNALLLPRPSRLQSSPQFFFSRPSVPLTFFIFHFLLFDRCTKCLSGIFVKPHQHLRIAPGPLSSMFLHLFFCLSPLFLPTSSSCWFWESLPLFKQS